MGRKINLTGKVFDRWTVISEAGRAPGRQVKWFCRCVCGKEREVLGTHLRAGNSTSCGCVKKKRPTPGDRTDRVSRSTCKVSSDRFYQIWNGMKQRTSNPNHPSFNYYGGRGITVCERWLDFGGFHEDTHADYLKHVEEYGEADTTLDRLNSDGNYEPSNCRWATRTEQARNRRTRSDSSTGVTGVGWHADKCKWQAYITPAGKLLHLGYFEKKTDAVEARKAAEEKFFGQAL